MLLGGLVRKLPEIAYFVLVAYVPVPFRNTLASESSALRTFDFLYFRSNGVEHPQITRFVRAVKESAFLTDNTLAGPRLPAFWAQLADALPFPERCSVQHTKVVRICSSLPLRVHE